jgi:hypothetical protein
MDVGIVAMNAVQSKLREETLFFITLLSSHSFQKNPILS